MFPCPACGKENADDASFCNQCGASLKSVPPPPEPPPFHSTEQSQTIGIGSKVSFRAQDGRVYSGTITEIRQGYYYVAYDGVNYGAWIEGRFLQAGATGSHAHRYGSSRPVEPGALIGSLMILIGFFLSWQSFGFGIGISAFRLVLMAGDFAEDSEQQFSVIKVLVLFIVLFLSGVLCFLYSVGVGLRRAGFSFFKFMPLLMTVLWIVFLLTNLNEEGDRPPDVANILQTLGIGFYLTLLGSIVLALSPGKRR